MVYEAFDFSASGFIQLLIRKPRPPRACLACSCTKHSITNRHECCRASVSDAKESQTKYAVGSSVAAVSNGRTLPDDADAGESAATLKQKDAALSLISIFLARSLLPCAPLPSIPEIPFLHMLKLARLQLSLAATLAAFTFYLGNPISSIPAFVTKFAGGLSVCFTSQAGAIAAVIVSNGTIAKCSVPFSS
jgi:hypothetical protein